MEDLPEYVKVGNIHYFLNISKDKGNWEIGYYLTRVYENSVELEYPPHFLAEGELNQCIVDIKRQIVNTSSQPRATK